MTRRLLVTLVVIAAAIAGTQASAANEGGARVEGQRVLFPANCRRPVYKPARIVVSCADANFVVEKIGWRSWTSRRAAGTGTASVNDCTPDCAQGAFQTYPVRIALSTPKQCRSGRPLQFVRVAITFTAARPEGFPRNDRLFYGCGFG